MSGLWKRFNGLATSVTVLIAAMCMVRPALAATFSIVFNLDSNIGNTSIYDVLTADSAGRLYGTALSHEGSTFVLFPPSPTSPAWSEQILYNFSASGSAGFMPAGGVTLTPGALIGTTEFGGADDLGTAYTITNPSAPNLTVIHSFSGTVTTPVDASNPTGGLTPGKNKLLYGATAAGGAYNLGAIVAIAPSATNPHYNLLYSFGRQGDGVVPGDGRLAIDSLGRIFGATGFGGANGKGTVFMLTPSRGAWQEQVIYSFQATGDLYTPLANVVLDPSGNVYGCAQGGTHGQGGLFRLNPPGQSGNPWTETVLYNFGDKAFDPIATSASAGCGITYDHATGGLVGTSYGGGPYFSDGTLYELMPPAAGQTAWTETVIHAFNGSPIQGAHPVAPPVLVNGTYYGGNLSGAIYAFTP